MTILVTGGAGYIGSHIVLALIDRGEEVVVLDNLATGIRALAGGAVFVQGDVADRALIRDLIAHHGIDSVIHAAGSAVVPESMADPLRYYANNTTASHALIETCIGAGIARFIFSSSAAVYGVPGLAPVGEDAAAEPINPYGRSKLMTEWMLRDAARAHPRFRQASVRYCNVAGADPLGRTGQSTPHATHLIKRACQVALGRHPHLEIFGTDYPTPDGTALRDYVHVADLAAAHLLLLDALAAGETADCFNCGYGRGVSVGDVVGALEIITGKPLPVERASRRPGDPPAAIADATRLRRQLGWTPQYQALETIVGSALAWERRAPV